MLTAGSMDPHHPQNKICRAPHAIRFSSTITAYGAPTTGPARATGPLAWGTRYIRLISMDLQCALSSRSLRQ